MSIGKLSNTTQNSLERQELDELKKQNKQIQELQNAREKEQKQLISNLTGATKDFRDNGIKGHNTFTHMLKEKLDKVDTDELANILGRDIHKVCDENERMLQEVKASYEAYQKN